MAKTMPLQHDENVDPSPVRRLPWAIAERVYAAYAARYGTKQSIECIAERGGFGTGECDMLYPEWRSEIEKPKQPASPWRKSSVEPPPKDEAILVARCGRIFTAMKWAKGPDADSQWYSGVHYDKWVGSGEPDYWQPFDPLPETP